jgi:hypothetical protein
MYICCLLLLGFLYLCLMGQGAFAGEPSVVELKDGSIIAGEVVSFDGNTWVIESPSMGRLKIESAKVVSIRSQTTAGQAPIRGTATGNQVNAAEMKAMQQSLMANERLMTLIMNLQDDPEVQAILQDPAIMQAVNKGDMNALLANPKFKKLMENDEIKAITREALAE